MTPDISLFAQTGDRTDKRIDRGPALFWFVAVLVAFLFPWASWSLSCSAQDTVMLQGPPDAAQMQSYNLMQQAIGKIQSGKSAEAVPLLEQAVQGWPTMPHVHYYLGHAYQNTGAYAKAIPEFQRALESDSRRMDVMINIGTCYQLTGEAGKAADSFEEYLKRAPGSPKSAQIKNSIAALRKHAAANPQGSAAQSPDYFVQVCKDGAPHRWLPHRMPLKVFIANGTNENSKPVLGFSPDYNYTVLEALNEWVRASGGKISYVIVPHIAQSDISVCWTDDPTLAGYGGKQVEQGLTLRHESQSRDGAFEITHASIVMFVMDRNTSMSLTREAMKRACLHEVGHALGMAGHSSMANDVMFYSESPLKQAQLSPRDCATMSRLYANHPIVVR